MSHLRLASQRSTVHDRRDVGGPQRKGRPVRRRAFLQTAGVAAGILGGGWILAACGDGAPSRVGASASAAPPATAGTGGQLNVIPGSFFPLTGKGERVAFGLTTLENEPVEDVGVEVTVRDTETGEVVSGPFPATFHDDLGEGFGLYVARVDLPEPGPVAIVAETAHGVGEQVLNAVAPADSPVPAPGDEAITTATPTTEEDLGVARVCTQDPPCGMHEVSLEDALAQGRPVVLLFATPAYCQTIVCGPAVATVDEVRRDGDWGDAAFIHAEIYTDEGSTLAPFVLDWELPSEPWLFGIGADGRITARIDGAILASDAEALAAGATDATRAG
ncbi:hypothetical protein BH20ACT8_BH20ACT8_16920 [soil metagenome]